MAPSANQCQKAAWELEEGGWAASGPAKPEADHIISY